MALRTIRIDGDPVLRKISREVTVMNDRIRELIVDMKETMYEAEGVGLAAPQVGVLRRVIVVDIGEGSYAMINPEITERDGEQIGPEGCLSVPGFQGTVNRPEKLVLRYLDEDWAECEIEAEGFFARAICHEIDHLNGVLFKDIYIDEVIPEEEEAESDGESKDESSEESSDGE